MRSPPPAAASLAKIDSSIESIESSKFSSIDEQDSLGEASVATHDLRREVKRQCNIIKKHEAFIKQLKRTLEALLGERLGKGSNRQTPEWRQDLMDLRTLLKFDESSERCSLP